LHWTASDVLLLAGHPVATGPGFVITIGPGISAHGALITNRPFLNFTLFGVWPLIVIVAPVFIPVPVTSSTNAPPAVRLSVQAATAGRGSLQIGGGSRHLKTTWIPSSLPVGHPAGRGSVEIRFRLCPFGPLTKIKNVLPAFADPKLKSASIRFAFKTTKLIAFTRLFGFPSSTANTDVTLVVPFGSMKQNPEINRSCGLAQSSGPVGVVDFTTGALNPRSIWHIVVRLNNPNRLLSPCVYVVVDV
jgi:hypothetical protein